MTKSLVSLLRIHPENLPLYATFSALNYYCIKQVQSIFIYHFHCSQKMINPGQS